jgi:hypothetical protein
MSEEKSTDRRNFLYIIAALIGVSLLRFGDELLTLIRRHPFLTMASDNVAREGAKSLNE